MKKLWIFLILLTLWGCQSQKEVIKDRQEETVEEEVSEKMQEIYIEIDEYLCKAELYQNKATQELLKELPKSYSMEELNGNEKYCYLEKTLPTSSENINEIKKGDIMLFGNNCLVVFYKDFKTQYLYTKIGRVKDIDEFLERLPKGKIELTFHKEQ
ncbi:MAG: cyclophilin-like fold protein [Coprobacillus sp.]